MTKQTQTQTLTTQQTTLINQTQTTGKPIKDAGSYSHALKTPNNQPHITTKPQRIIYPATPQINETTLINLANSYANFIAENCPLIETSQVDAKISWEEKQITITNGASLYSLMPETLLRIKLTSNNHTLEESYGVAATPEDFLQDEWNYHCANILHLYNHLQNKAQGYPITTTHKNATCVIAPRLSSKIIAQTLGHHAKADIMRDCFPRSPFIMLPRLSPKLSVIDFAHTSFDQPTDFPIIMDDEGTLASNVALITGGQMDMPMTNCETAAQMGLPLTGNARTHSYKQKPQIHTRNLALMPWDDMVSDILASVEDGYLLVDGDGFTWDYEGRFAFDLRVGYFIRDGRICEAITSAKVAGRMREFLQSISMIGSDFVWYFNGDIDKHEVRSTSGSPTIKACLDIREGVAALS